MPNRYVKKEAFKVAGISGHDGHDTDFSLLWVQLMDGRTLDELIKLGSGENYGLCYNFKEDGNFSYMAGFDVEDEEKALEMGLEILEVPAADYVVFVLVGPVPESIQRGWLRVEEFFKDTGYEHGDSPDFEYYLEGEDMSQPDYKMELWVPLKKKD